MIDLLALEHAPYYWLALGALFLLFETLGASGIGFLFAGLGAITAGILAHIGMAETLWGQLAWFCAATAGWAAILWVPMRKYKLAVPDAPYNDMIGDEAVVTETGLRRGMAGQVRWSGTLMEARLDPASPLDDLPPGTAVVVTGVKGNAMIVMPEQVS